MGNSSSAVSNYHELEKSLHKQEQLLKEHLGKDFKKKVILNHKIYNSKGVLIYQGGYTHKHKRLHGQGKMFRQTGEIFYEGLFNHGLPHGKGTLYLPNNLRIEGIFNKAKLEGFGTTYFDDNDPTKREVYHLEVKDGQINYE
jgi:antitoxin component YwqK of YwqJK toxin-antitoxin module